MAEHLLRSALDALVTLHGPLHLETLAGAVDLADILKFKEAEPLWREAIAPSSAARRGAPGHGGSAESLPAALA